MLRFIKRNDSKNTDEAAISLSKETGYDFNLCRLLCQRGIFDKKAAEDFLMPSVSQLCSPFGFTQMERAISRIRSAFAEKEKVCIYGDYDVDGVCATSILYMYLQHEGYDVMYYIPSRKNEGYGMNTTAVEHLHELGVNLIITVDNGITAHKEIALAYRLGMDVIITDHHKCTDVPPVCAAVICHTCEGEEYENHAICGAGTALKLVEALGGEAAAREFLPYAGLATVADVVELTGENRAILSLALRAINNDECPVGIRAIIDVAKQNKNNPVTERDLAFGIAPRLNAAGRMSDATLGVELLCSKDSESAMQMAKRLDALNTNRRDEENEIISEAEEQIQGLDLTDTRIIILKSEKWNAGIVGIAAARLAEKYYRPTILFSQNGDTLTGSARSIQEVDLFEAMSGFSDMCIKFGGHSFAAGLTISLDKFDEYKSKLNEYIVSAYPFDTFIPKKTYDDEIELSELTVELTELTEKLAPFGEGNPKPIFLARNVTIEKLSRIGSELNHINGRVGMNGSFCDIVAFEKGYMFDTLMNADRCDIAFSPSINEWGNNKRVQLRVLDFLPSGIEDSVKYFDKHTNDFMESFLENLIVNPENPLKKTYSCTEAFIKSSLKSSCDGNMILCMDKSSACKLTDILREGECDVDAAFHVPTTAVSAFNTVIYAPDIEKLKDFSKNYYRVTVCGTVCEKQIMRISEIFGNAAVYVLYNDMMSDEAQSFISVCDRHKMGDIYKATVNQMRDGKVYLDEVCAGVAESLKVNVSLCKFGIETFIELDLFLKDKNGRICANNIDGKVELTASELYNAAISYTCFIQKSE